MVRSGEVEVKSEEIWIMDKNVSVETRRTDQCTGFTAGSPQGWKNRVTSGTVPLTALQAGRQRRRSVMNKGCVMDVSCLEGLSGGQGRGAATSGYMFQHVSTQVVSHCHISKTRDIREEAG